jgi:hypothetical protein
MGTKGIIAVPCMIDLLLLVFSVDCMAGLLVQDREYEESRRQQRFDLQ